MAIVLTLGSAPAPSNPAFAGGNLTITGMNGGTNFPANSKVVFGLCETSFPLSGVVVTMGGNAMTQVIDFDFSSSGCAIWYYDVGGASITDTTVITSGGNGGWAGALAYYMTGAASGTASVTGSIQDAGAPPQSLSLSGIPTGAVTILVAGSLNATSYTPSWTNTTSGAGDLNTASTTHIQTASAHSLAVGSQTFTVNAPGFTSSVLLGASWAPAGAAVNTVAPPFPVPRLPWSYIRNRTSGLLEPVRELWRPRRGRIIAPGFSF
jgi:hypothetical protein